MGQGDLWQHMREHLSDMGRAVDEALRSVPPFGRFLRGERPPVNIYETNEALIVRAELPGVRKEDLDVRLKEGALLIEGTEDRSEYDSYTCLGRERGAGKFSRELALPEDVDEEAEPAASLQDGVLTIRLQKKPRQRGRAIEVEEG